MRLSDIVSRDIRWYGRKAQLADQRDRAFVPRRGVSAVTLPETVDPRKTAPLPIYNQGSLGSCTGNAYARILRRVLQREGHPDFEPSRLFIYGMERRIEGDYGDDAGAEMRTGAKVLAKFGAPPEADWPYVIKTFNRPVPRKATRDAKLHIATEYQAVPQTEIALKSAIVENGNVAIGISVYQSFESEKVATTGVVPLPEQSEALLGGHALDMDGYLQINGEPHGIVANSWDYDWALDGYCLIPFRYLLNPALAGDFWTIKACS